MDQFVELNRMFFLLDDENLRPEDSAFRSYMARKGLVKDDCNWKQVLQHRLVVVLGEPGSGKTREFQQQYFALARAGEDAILIELDRLVSHSVEDSLILEDREMLSRWKRSNRTCTFFLDSVDEAKFKKASDFHHALAKLRDSLGRDNLVRTRIVISSRITGWDPRNDREKVIALFGITADERKKSADDDAKDHSQSLLVYQLQPLDPFQVKKLLDHLNVPSSDSLLKEIEHNHVWELVGRPLDVDGIAEYWRVNKRIGSLKEIIEHSIHTKLKPRIGRDGTSLLSESDARAGAEALAAATVLCRQQQFRVPSESLKAPEGLDGTLCLPDTWQIQETHELLSRPLFNSASYGTIRFYHRTVSDYLAASWLARMMNESCPITVMEQLLFDTHGGKRTLRRSLAPIIAWLCCGQEPWRADVRAWVLTSAPEVHLQYGDPSQLPTPYRRQILEAIIESYRGRKRSWIETATVALMRLADPELSPIITKFILDTSSSNDLRIELIRICRYEQMKDCWPILVTLITNPADDIKVRAYALQTLRDSGSSAFDSAIWQFCQHSQALPDDFCELAIELLYPRCIGAKDVAFLISKTANIQDKSNYLPWHLEQHFERVLEPGHCVPLLAEMNDLLIQKPLIFLSEKETRLSREYLWILDLLPTVLAKLLPLSAEQLSKIRCDVIADSIELINDAIHLRQLSDQKVVLINELFCKFKECRQLIFTRAIERWTREHPEFPPHLTSLTHVTVPVSQDDTTWIIEKITATNDHQLNNNLLHVVLQLLRSGSKTAANARLLRQTISFDPRLKAACRSHRNAKCWGWLRRLYYKIRNLSDSKYKWLMRWYASKQMFNTFRWRMHLWFGYFSLKNGRWVGALEQLSYEARFNHSPKTPGKWGQLEKKYGRWITDATKQGCRAFWRRYTPRLPHEKPVSNRIDSYTLLGLAGLEVSFSTGELTSGTLTSEEVILATRYACNEIGTFPKWLAKLAKLHPDEVGSVLKQCVQGEWNYKVDRESAHDVLSRLSWEGGENATLVKDDVVALLKHGDPQHRSILDYSAQIVARVCASDDPAVVSILLKRFNDSRIGYHPFVLWCAVGLLIASEKTVAELEKNIQPSGLADQIMLHICDLLCNRHDRRLSMNPKPSYLSLSTLRVLIPLIYRHVRPDEEAKRLPGMAHAITTRDEIAQFRSSLLSSIVSTPSEDGIQALQDLAKAPELENDREWIHHLIAKAHNTIIDSVVRRESDIRSIQKTYECEARTDTELYDIVGRRLINIKYSIEKSDNSRRNEVPHGCKEAELRRWIARNLNVMSADLYAIAQEVVVDYEKRPDIRVVSPRTAPVSIEVKWADKWTLEELMAGLEVQLIGQYLKDHNSRYGLYVLGCDGREKEKWKDERGQLIDFDSVVERVKKRALELSTRRNGLEEVCVVSLDFRSEHPP